MESISTRWAIVRLAWIAALAPAILLGACATPVPLYQTTPLPSMTVDRSFRGFQYEEGDILVGPYKVTNVFKIFDADGALGVCGAYVADIPPQSQALLERQYRGAGVYMDIGGVERGPPGVRFSPEFMIFDRQPAPPRLEGIEAGCVRVDVPWKATFPQEKVFFSLGSVHFSR